MIISEVLTCLFAGAPVESGADPVQLITGVHFAGAMWSSNCMARLRRERLWSSVHAAIDRKCVNWIIVEHVIYTVCVKVFET